MKKALFNKFKENTENLKSFIQEMLNCSTDEEARNYINMRINGNISHLNEILSFIAEPANLEKFENHNQIFEKYNIQKPAFDDFRTKLHIKFLDLFEIKERSEEYEKLFNVIFTEVFANNQELPQTVGINIFAGALESKKVDLVKEAKNKFFKDEILRTGLQYYARMKKESAEDGNREILRLALRDYLSTGNSLEIIKLILGQNPKYISELKQVFPQFQEQRLFENFSLEIGDYLFELENNPIRLFVYKKNSLTETCLAPKEHNYMYTAGNAFLPNKKTVLIKDKDGELLATFMLDITQEGVERSSIYYQQSGAVHRQVLSNNNSGYRQQFVKKYAEFLGLAEAQNRGILFDFEFNNQKLSGYRDGLMDVGDAGQR